MNHTEAAQYIKATLTAFGPGEAISMTKETWAKIHEAMQVLAQPEQEPVAWFRYETVYEYKNQLARCTKDCIGAFPVYTTPPQPEQSQVEETLRYEIDALETKLAECRAQQQKPVAWRAWFDADNGARWLFSLWPEEERLNVEWTPLYTAPPQRTWQGLTDEEMDTEADKKEQGYGFIQGALWAEDKLKEKNHG